MQSLPPILSIHTNFPWSRIIFPSHLFHVHKLVRRRHQPPFPIPCFPKLRHCFMLRSVYHYPLHLHYIATLPHHCLSFPLFNITSAPQQILFIFLSLQLAFLLFPIITDSTMHNILLHSSRMLPFFINLILSSIPTHKLIRFYP